MLFTERMEREPDRGMDRGAVGYERIVAFSDGVFAIRALGPSVLSYFIGFAVIGLFWLGHHRLFNAVRDFNARIVRMNIVYLSLVSLMPFTTGLLGNYGSIYAANVAGASLAGTAMSVVALALVPRVLRYTGLVQRA